MGLTRNEHLLGHAVIHGRLDQYGLIIDETADTHCTADVVEQPIIVDTIYLGLVRVSPYVGPPLPPEEITIASIRD